MASLILSGCMQAGIELANLPLHFSGVEVQRGLAYGDHPRQRLDLYLPPSAAAGEHLPLVVFFYGGRWSGGQKEDYGFVGLAFARHGYAVAIPDYRLYPEVVFPAFIEDGARALAWLRRERGELGAEGAFLLGHSAGAHTVALLAADASYLAAWNLDSSAIRAVAGLAGPYAFTPDTPELEAIFGPPSRYPIMRVPTHVQGGEPPMLLVHGEADRTVSIQNLTVLASALRREGVTVETVVFPGKTHVSIIAGLSWLSDRSGRILEALLSFFEQQGAA